MYIYIHICTYTYTYVLIHTYMYAPYSLHIDFNVDVFQILENNCQRAIVGEDSDHLQSID